MTKPPRKITVTDEMRAAVLAEMCTTQGHQLTFSNVLSLDGSNRLPSIEIQDNKLPHIICTRCKQVWIVNDIPAPDYDTAEEMIRLGAKNTTKIDELRKRRREDQAPVDPVV